MRRPSGHWCGIVLLLALVVAPVAGADPIPNGSVHLGAELDGGFGFRVKPTMLASVFGGYTVYKGIEVGVIGSYSLAGLPLWRAGGFAEIFLGPDSIRPYAQIRLEAIGQGSSAALAIGFSFGFSFQLTKQWFLNPTFGFDGNTNVEGQSIGLAGLNARYVF